MKRTRVILDTNALMRYGEHVDVLRELSLLVTEPHEFLIPEAVLEELGRLARGKGRAARAARLGLVIIRQELASRKGLLGRLFNPKQIPLKTVSCSGEHADDAILKIAEEDAIVCTLDKGLQERLLQREVRVISARGKRFCFVE